MTAPTAFAYQALPMRVAFGVGAMAKVGEELDRAGLSRALVLCTPEQRPLAQTSLTEPG